MRILWYLGITESKIESVVQETDFSDTLKKKTWFDNKELQSTKLYLISSF